MQAWLEESAEQFDSLLQLLHDTHAQRGKSSGEIGISLVGSPEAFRGKRKLEKSFESFIPLWEIHKSFS